MNWIIWPRRIVLPLVAALVAGVNTASAATFTYSSYSVAGEQGITITSPSNVSGGMGQIDLTGSAPSSAGITILAWCLDVYTYLLSAGTYNVSLLTPTTSALGFGTSDATPPASEVGSLTPIQIAKIGGLIAYGNANLSDSAATQLAIWEVEYGTNTFKFTGVSDATKDQATAEISELDKTNGISLDSNVALLTAIDGESNQTLAYDFNPLGPPSNQDPSPTPLPSTLPLFAAGIGLVGLLGWRRKRNTVASVAA